MYCPIHVIGYSSKKKGCPKCNEEKGDKKVS